MEKLDDLAARHATHLHRYGTYTLNKITKILKGIDSRLALQLLDSLDSMTKRETADFLAGRYSTKRLKLLRDSIAIAAGDVRQAVSTVIGSNGKDLAGHEIENSEKVVASVGALASLINGYTKLTKAAAYKKVLSTPIKGRHMRDMTADISTRYQKALYSQIRDGMLNGENSTDILKRVRGTAAQLKKDGINFRRDTDIEAFTRTSMTHISAVAAEESYAAMGVEKIVYRATLDGRTTKICASLDGNVYRIGKGPRPPQHINCRSSIIPYDKYMDWNRPSVADKRPVAKIPKGERKDVIKRVPASKTYKTWFDDQSESYKKEWLGLSRYKLYKEGVSLDRFADPRTGRQYNLAQLKKMDSQAFKDAGL